MNKLLFYGDEKEEFLELLKRIDKLEEEFEVAVSTSNYDLVPYLAVAKLLVVHPESYYPDLVVSNKKLGWMPEKVLSHKELFEIVGDVK